MVFLRNNDPGQRRHAGACATAASRLRFRCRSHRRGSRTTDPSDSHEYPTQPEWAHLFGCRPPMPGRLPGRNGRPRWATDLGDLRRGLQSDSVRQSPLCQPWHFFHPYSMLAHTYSKTTLTPGQRLGYLALAPGVPQPEAMRTALFHVLISSGLAMPDAVMQYALPDIDGLCIDVAAIQRRRDRMVAELQKQGYQLHVPRATFTCYPRRQEATIGHFARCWPTRASPCSRVTSSNCPATSASPSQLPTTWSKKRSPFSLTRFSAPTRPCPPDPPQSNRTRECL